MFANLRPCTERGRSAIGYWSYGQPTGQQLVIGPLRRGSLQVRERRRTRTFSATP